MKKFVLFAAIICLRSSILPRATNTSDAMKANIAQLDSMMGKGNAAEIANNFERIGDAEKTQWLPYYYAAYCTVMQGYD